MESVIKGRYNEVLNFKPDRETFYNIAIHYANCTHRELAISISFSQDMGSSLQSKAYS